MARKREHRFPHHARALSVRDANALVAQGAGNVFKDGEAEQAKQASNDSAIEDKQESLAQKSMNFLLGKKNDKQQATKS